MESPNLYIKSVDTYNDIKEVIKLHRLIWGLDDFELTPPHIYRATLENGGHILLVYKNKTPVGFIYGFPGIDKDRNNFFYIHNLGIKKQFRSSGIGLKLNLHLRKILIKEGYELVKWTFDPLETSNANLYIGKMGGITNKYITNYYGIMTDAINKQITSDRLIISWWINSSFVKNKIKTKTSAFTINDIKRSKCINLIDKKKRPITNNFTNNLNTYYLECPVNYHQIKKNQPETIKKWRIFVRDVLQSFFSKEVFIIDALYSNSRFFYVLSDNPLKK